MRIEMIGIPLPAPALILMILEGYLTCLKVCFEFRQGLQAVLYRLAVLASCILCCVRLLHAPMLPVFF